MSRDHNESAPKLYIEFEDDDAAAVADDADLVSDHEAIGNAPTGRTPRWQPGWSLGTLPIRYRKWVAGTAALVGLTAAIGDSLAAQATQRAADRSAVSVMDAAYSPNDDGGGLDLLIDVTDAGHETLTVTQAQVQQSDLHLDYFGGPVELNSHQQYELVLWGRYDCSSPGSTGSGGTASAQQTATPTTVRVTVRSSQGDVNTLVLPLPADAQLPDPWRDGRTAYCALAWGG